MAGGEFKKGAWRLLSTMGGEDGNPEKQCEKMLRKNEEADVFQRSLVVMQLDCGEWGEVRTLLVI